MRNRQLGSTGHDSSREPKAFVRFLEPKSQWKQPIHAYVAGLMRKQTRSERQKTTIRTYRGNGLFEELRQGLESRSTEPVSGTNGQKYDLNFQMADSDFNLCATRTVLSKILDMDIASFPVSDQSYSWHPHSRSARRY